MQNLESEEVQIAVIIPSYREFDALPTLLKELGKKLRVQDAIIVVDDSPQKESLIIEKNCRNALENSSAKFLFVGSGMKSGRGHAIRRGLLIARDRFKNLKYAIECDADGSHRVQDIIKMRDYKYSVDLLIGSRYLSESKIQGWPISRRVFSRLLNKLIPVLLLINVTDLTNGLRRYSIAAITKILETPQVNPGFIYLSEQALIVHKSKLSISEIPITFINRVEGESTVTLREIILSLKGVQKLIKKKN